MADKQAKEGPKDFEEITVELTPTGEPSMGRIYANYVQVSHSPWEFTVRFCLAPAGADIKKSVKQDTNTVEIPIIIDVMISPTLIKPIIKALQINFDKFEKKSEKLLATETTT